MLSPLPPANGELRFRHPAACAALGALLPDLDASESKIKHLKLPGTNFKLFLLPAQIVAQAAPFRLEDVRLLAGAAQGRAAGLPQVLAGAPTGPNAVEYVPRLGLGEFYFGAYRLPAEPTRGKAQVTVRFQARGAGLAAGVWGLSALPASALPVG